MPNTWTGGQYSLVRVLLSIYLAGALLAMPGLDPELPVLALAIAGALLCVGLALGWYDQWFAGLLLGLWFLMHLFVPELYFAQPLGWWAWVVGLVLVVHLLTPLAPYGSLDAAGRDDPAGGWRYPPWLLLGLWVVLGLYYLSHALVLLGEQAWHLGDALFIAPDTAGLWAAPALPDPLARAMTWLLWGAWLAFAPLALTRTTRPLGWSLALLANLLVLIPAGFPGLALSLTALHLLAFEPQWLPRRLPAARETVFYDGLCGLCHRGARFLLAEDTDGRLFALSPLQSEHFKQVVPAQQREHLPDSIVVQRDDGELLVRSAAVLHTLDRLGGYWRVLGLLAGLAPRPLRDWGYDRVAATRRRWFPQPPAACPLTPEHLRGRFIM